MPVDATWRLQSNSALVTATSSFTASLPNPTTDGSTLLLFAGTSGSGTIQLGTSSFDPPWFSDLGASAVMYTWRRDAQPAGETSWVIPTIGISSVYYWRIEEWAGLSSIDQPDASGTRFESTQSLTCATDQASTITADASDFAALSVFRVAPSSPAAAVWATARSYGAGASAGPSAWNEVDYLVNGDGTHATDFILAIAEAYPGAAGNVGCTLTLDTSGGGGTPNHIDGWSVCYQPAAAAPPAGILTS